MCGIAGVVGEEAASAEARTRRMLDLMAHRGPDGNGVVSHGRTALGMCRLRIRSPVGLAVPMAMASHGGHAAYNGEVYGLTDADGHEQPPPAGGVGEVEYILQGKAGLVPDGMFSLAVAGAGAPGATVWRDAFGIKPLYWHQGEGVQAFASELPALLGALPAPPVRHQSLVDMMAFGRVLGPATFFEGIHRLPSGVTARLDGTRLDVLHQRHPLPRGETAGFQPEELRRAVRSALERCLLSERTMGLAVSGGLDSTILAAELSLAGFEGLRTVSIRTEGATDGCERLEELELPGTAWKTWRHSSVLFTAAMLPEAIERSVRLLGEPSRMTSIPLYLSLAELAHQQEVVVLLCGEGADELFAGYSSYQAWASDGAGRSTFERLYSYAFPSPQRDAVQRLLGPQAVASCEARFRETFGHLAELPPAQALREMELVNRLEPLLIRADHALMRHCIEGRVPFLHGRVPALAAALSEEDLVTPGRAKIALRRTWQDVVPRRLVEGPKTNFRAPISRWLQGPLAGWMRDRFEQAAPGLEALGLRREGLQWLVRETLRGESHAAALAFCLVSVAAWLDWRREGDS